MIKFFRNIRQKAFSENKFGKYLTYAIGEIILVVIGILIALGINNWNENRKQHANDLEFLQSLRNEIVLDSTSIANRIRFYHNINSDIEKTIQMIDTATVLSSANRKMISKTIEMTEVLLPTYKNLDRNGGMLTSGALKRISPELNNSYLNYLDNFKFSYDLGNKMTNSLNESINAELYTNVDLNFTKPGENHILFDLASVQNNRAFCPRTFVERIESLVDAN